MAWVNCPQCDQKLTCKFYAQMKAQALLSSEQVCSKGCK